LIAYLKEGLSPERRQLVEDHLAACGDCTRSVQQAQTLEAELRLQAARHNPTLSPGASARIHERVYRRMRRGLMMQRTVKLVGVAVAVVAIALLAVGVAALWQGRPQDVAVEEEVTPELSEGVPTLVPPTPVPATSVPPTGVPEGTPSAGDAWTRPVDGAVMVYVPAGEFLMGSSDGDPDAADREKPQHTVYLDAFWIDKLEVTNAQYRKCVEAGACQAPRRCEGDKGFYEDETKGNHPVVCVNWNKAQDYAAWVGGRLPTEAEWEKAARGTDGRLYPWGNSPPDCSKANLYGCVEGPRAGETLPVGSHPDGASPYGALEMGGNVLEWVADWWDEGYYAGSPARNPQGPESGSVKVLRGSAFPGAPEFARCASRVWGPGGPEFEPGYYDLGFRVVVAPGAFGP
jgi:formylglycine-generating enzyme required for sulfatase activity